MNKNLIILLPVVLCVTSFSYAQFILKGKIEFEKTVNVYKQMDLGDDGWAATLKKQTPEYRHTYFNLIFSDGKTLYEPGRESGEKASPLVKARLLQILYTPILIIRKLLLLNRFLMNLF